MSGDGRTEWPLWLVIEHGRDVAIVAAPTSSMAAETAGLTLSAEVTVERLGMATAGCRRVVRWLATGPTFTGRETLGRLVLAVVAARAGIPVTAALESHVPVAIAVRWATWLVLIEGGISLAEAGRQIGGHHHTTVRHAVPRARKRLSEKTFAALVEAGRQAAAGH